MAEGRVETLSQFSVLRAWRNRGVEVRQPGGGIRLPSA